MKPLHVALAFAFLLGSIATLWLLLPSTPPVVIDVPVVRIGSDERDPDPPPSVPLDATDTGGLDDGDSEDDRASVASDDDEEEPLPTPNTSQEPADDAPKSALHGLLVDATTREPLPEFQLRLRDASGRSEDVVTDAEGRFATQHALALGVLNIRLRDGDDGRRNASRIEREHPGDAEKLLELEVRCGPTFPLAFDPPAFGETALSARLKSEGRDARSTEYVAVRGGSPRWVRLPDLGDAEPPLQLEVRSDDGLWTGRADVARARGVERRAVLVRGMARAVVRGRVIDAEERPIEKALVTLHLTGGPDAGQRKTERTESDGLFRFAYLSGGAATLSVEAFRYAPEAARAVAIEVGKETALDVVLAGVAVAGSIKGRVTSETGRFEGPVTMMLTSTSPNASRSGGPEHAEVAWHDEGGKKVGVFEFASLPAGGYRVSGSVGGDWYEMKPEWEPRSVLATPPHENASFLLRDGGARADLVLRVTALDTGQPVDAFFARLSVGSRERSRQIWGSDPAVVNALYTSKIGWWVVKDGYQPAVGDESAFAIEKPCEGKRCRIAEVGLRPGWGDVYEVQSRATSKPIAGVKVFIDEREVGTTDARGRVLVTADRVPRELRFQHDDWRTVGRVDLARSARRISEGPNRVRMSPPEPKK